MVGLVVKKLYNYAGHCDKVGCHLNAGWKVGRLLLCTRHMEQAVPPVLSPLKR